MLRTIRSVPKTARSAGPSRRLIELADWLEEAERRACYFESPERAERRRADPILGIPTRAVVYLRQLARHWDARAAAGFSIPLIGRLRKETAVVREGDHLKKLIALGDWIRAKGFASKFWGNAQLSPQLIASFVYGHTTCGCSICSNGGSLERTCQLVAACRAAVALYEHTLTGPGSPLRELVRTNFAAMNALWDAAYQIIDAAPELEVSVERLEADPGEVERLLQQPDLPIACGLEISAVVLRKIAQDLKIYGQDRCTFHDISLADAGVARRGAPERWRAPEQHLAHGGLGFARRRGRVTVEVLRKAPRRRAGMVDQRVRFIPAKAGG